MKNRFIMIIDDDPDDTTIFCEVINKYAPDVECIEFNQPEKALSYLYNEENIKPNWIFLDLNMPRMNGFECLTKIKTIDHLCNVPVIIYSTSALVEDIEKTKKLGASGYLTKPTEFDKIFREVNKWMV